MEAHTVNVSKHVQTPQLSSYNQMSITKWVPAERWRSTPLTLGVYETQRETDSRKQRGWPSTWHEFYADQQWSPQEVVNLGTKELHPDTYRQFDSSTLLQTSVPRRSRQGFLNYAGTWAMNKGC